MRGIDLKIDDIWGLDLSMTGRATVLSLPDISGFDKETAVGKPIVISIFNHRNVGHKQHARPTKL